MKLLIDAGMCTGHGRCYTLAPTLLSDDDEGFVCERGAPLEVPVDLEGEAREAALSCPEGAIAVLD